MKEMYVDVRYAVSVPDDLTQQEAEGVVTRWLDAVARVAPAPEDSVVIGHTHRTRMRTGA